MLKLLGVRAAASACVCFYSSTVWASLPVAAVEDAIGMQRIQYRAAQDGTVGAFSPDGRKFATVLWRGDLTRNTNVYSLLVFDLRDPSRAVAPPSTVLTRDFPGDRDDQQASPIQQLTFLGDNRTLAFLGREDAGPAQVYTLDTETKALRQLTSHPTPVRSFIVSSDGALRAFSAVAHEDDDGGQAKRARLEEDGVFLWDTSLFAPVRRFFKATPLLIGTPRHIRQYFVQSDSGPRLFFDSRRSRAAVPLDLSDPRVARSVTVGAHEESALSFSASLTADRQGRRALLFPYALTEHPMRPERYDYYARYDDYVRRIAAPSGVVDLATGRIERLIDAPHAQANRYGLSAAPLWSPDGRSVIVYSLLPIEGDVATIRHAAEQPPQWLEIELATRRYTTLPVPTDWDVVRWDASDTGLVLQKGASFRLLRRHSNGTWETPSELGTVTGLNRNWPVATDGRLVIGVKDALLTPPELVAFDLSDKQTRVLTALNPQLHHRRYGAVDTFRWAHRYDREARAFLVKPVDYRPGVRYPLVILLDDGTLRGLEEPYLLDAAWQLSGHAIQMLAGHGFMVLYARQPGSLREVVGTPQEGEHMREHIEGAIGALDRSGLIDPRRVGLSGWSRAGYHTVYLLIHASHAFAAASQIDGGAREYNDGMRPFKDEELKRIRTPLLFEPHRLATLVTHAAMANRMEAFDKPTEILYFASASHSTVRPRHRLRSLGVHLDWWRFWLKDEEDEAPAKAEQYARWRELRRQQELSALRAGSGPRAN